MQTRRVLSAAACAALIGSALTLSACNTVHGMGQDASAVGHDVSAGARATQNAVTSNTGAARN